MPVETKRGRAKADDRDKVQLCAQALCLEEMLGRPVPRGRGMALIGYARVSTEEQVTDTQLDDLRAAGCTLVFEEHASGAARSWPRRWPGWLMATPWWWSGSTAWRAR